MLPLTYVVILLTQTDLNISTIVTNSNNYSDCVLGSVGGFWGEEVFAFWVGFVMDSCFVF